MYDELVDREGQFAVFSLDPAEGFGRELAHDRGAFGNDRAGARCSQVKTHLPDNGSGTHRAQAPARAVLDVEHNGYSAGLNEVEISRSLSLGKQNRRCGEFHSLEIVS